VSELGPARADGVDDPFAAHEAYANDPFAGDAFDVVRSFVDAIVWGEHLRVWQLFSPEAREHVLRAASRKGLDAVAAERARQETWGRGEADAFLTSLLHGLRVDLSGVDLERILISEHPVLMVDGSLRFDLENPTNLPSALTGGANWAAGAVVVDLIAGATPAWRVKLLVPRPATRPET
jgi:hypothetical protein